MARWEDYVRARDGDAPGVEDLWLAARDGERTTVYVLGEGFDPRATVGLERFLSVVTERCVVVSVQLRTDRGDAVTADLAANNRARLDALCATAGVALERLPFPEVHEPGSAGLVLARSFVGSQRLVSTGHVVVDISGLPSGLYFPLIGSIITRVDEGGGPSEVQVVVCENPDLDEAIVEEGTSNAGPIAGFKNGLDFEASTGIGTRVWAPVLGRGQGPALQALHARLGPNEVCPVLPFPARNPRRADELVLELREFLFDALELDGRDFIFADENNPFDLYRTLSRLHQRYGAALQPLGPTTTILSTHASKSLSLGVFLAAFEYTLPVVTAGPVGYSIAVGTDLAELATRNRLACYWLVGAPYS